MTEYKISKQTVASFIGLLVLYAVILYIFWNSTVSFFNFKIDPTNSMFADLMKGLLGNRLGRQTGLVGAFVSVHLAWHYKTVIGRWLMFRFGQ